jgi:hypothetical protein
LVTKSEVCDGELPAAAQEAAGFGAGVLEDRRAGDEGRLVALGPLHQALAASR